MANENEEVVEGAEETTEDTEETTEETTEEKDKKESPPEKDKKPETPEARKSRLDRMTEQHKKKYPELYKETTTKKDTTTKSDDLDYGQLAFLTAKGIESDEEIDFVKEQLQESGKPLKDLFGNKYFQAGLKEFREANATTNATPRDSKRPGQSASDTVEYWIAKGELPKDKELARKVVNARMAKEKKTDVFGED